VVEEVARVKAEEMMKAKEVVVEEVVRVMMVEDVVVEEEMVEVVVVQGLYVQTRASAGAQPAT
jgi:hypothetical protein